MSPQDGGELKRYFPPTNVESLWVCERVCILAYIYYMNLQEYCVRWSSGILSYVCTVHDVLSTIT